MCGIFGYISCNEDKIDNKQLKDSSIKCSHRGPDSTKDLIIKEGIKSIHFSFHRLAINGLTTSGNQPMTLNNKTLLCNGEIYNYKELSKKYNFELKTGSDCEVILHLAKIKPVNHFIHELDGVFSFMIYDSLDKSITVGHDPLGVRPLYWFKNNDNTELAFSSEMKSLYDICGTNKIEFYPPGSYSLYYMRTNMLHTYSFYNFEYSDIYDTSEIIIIKKIKRLLSNAVKKRLISDRPIGCLLSGGLDSSIITSLVCKVLDPSEVQTFAIGLKDSPDLLSAQKVADYLGTKHTNIVVSERDMLEAIDETIYQIESKDTTTVRASVPMFLLSKYIRDNTDIKVILSGEGSDEASGSYLYFHNAPDRHSFQAETIRLLKDVRMFDVLRADKTTAGAGLELRVPFFDKTFLKYYMGISPELKVVRDGMEKYLLRKAFEGELPEEIIWRRKDGFSDGVSKTERPWYEIIDEYSKENGYENENDMYSSIFTKYYSGCEDIIPYNWMPKWTEGIGQNPSGRLVIG